MSMTPAQIRSGLDRLARKASAAAKAKAKATDTLRERDQLAAELADAGVKWADLATAMGITVEGVTYVLRKMRRGTTDK